MSLKNVTIRNFFNLKNCVLRNLSPNLNILKGDNRLGKTNVFRAIRFALLDSSDEYRSLDEETFNAIVFSGNLDDFSVKVELQNTKQVLPDFLADETVTFKREYRRSNIENDPPVQYLEINQRLVSEKEYTDILSFLPATTCSPVVVANSETLLNLFTMQPHEKLKMFKEFIALSGNYPPFPSLTDLEACAERVQYEREQCDEAINEVHEEAEAAKQQVSLKADREGLQKTLKALQDDQLAVFRLRRLREKLVSKKGDIEALENSLNTCNRKRQEAELKLQTDKRSLEKIALEKEHLQEDFLELQEQLSKMELRNDDYNELEMLQTRLTRANSDICGEELELLRQRLENRTTLTNAKLELIDKKNRLATSELKFHLKRYSSQADKDNYIRGELQRREDSKRYVTQKIGRMQSLIDFCKTDRMDPSLVGQLAEKHRELKFQADAMRESTKLKDFLDLKYKQLRDAVPASSRLIVKCGVTKKLISHLLADGRHGKYLGMLLDFISCDEDVARAVEAAAGHRLFVHVVDTFKAEAFIRNRLNDPEIEILVMEKLELPRDLMTAEMDVLQEKLQYPPAMAECVEAIYGSTYLVPDIETAIALSRTSQMKCVTRDGDLADVTNAIRVAPKSEEHRDPRNSIVYQYWRYKRFAVDLQHGIDAAEQEIIRCRRCMDEISGQIRDIVAKCKFRDPETELLLRRQRRCLRLYEAELDDLRNERNMKDRELHFLRENCESDRFWVDDISASQINRMRREISDLEIQVSTSDDELNKQILNQELVVDKLNDEVVHLENKICALLDSGIELVDENEMTALKEKLNVVERQLQHDPEGRELSILKGQIQTCVNDLKDIELDAEMLESRLSDLQCEEKLLIGDVEKLQPRTPREFGELRERQRATRNLLLENQRELDVLDANANPISIKKEVEMNKRIEDLNTEMVEHENEIRALTAAMKVSQNRRLEQAEEAFNRISRGFSEAFPIFYRHDANGSQWTAKLVIQTRRGMQGHLFETAIGLDFEIKENGHVLNESHLLSSSQKSSVSFAFLIAMFVCNPPPFCLFNDLDSIFAQHLDKARFAEQLALMATQSQFIMVTSNECLEEKADVVYQLRETDMGSTVRRARRTRTEM